MNTRRFAITIALATTVSVGCEPPPAVAPEAATPATAEAPETEPTAAPGPTTPPADADVDQANLPPAEQVLEASVAAAGGRDKIASIKSYYKEEQADIPAQNMSATSKYWWKSGKLYAEVEMPGVGLMKVWKNEEGSWAEDPLNGLRKLEGEEAEQNERSSTLVLTADWKKFFAKAETTRRRKLGERTVVDVKLTADKGDELLLTFDEKEGKLIEQSFKQKTAMGEMPVRVTIEEWADYDGFKEAKVSTTDMKVMKVKTTVTKFESNPDIDDAKFRPPAGEKKAKAIKKKAKPKK